MFDSIVFDFAGVIATEGYTRWLKRYVSDLESKMKYFMDVSEVGDRAVEEMKDYLTLLSKGTGMPPDQIWPTMHEEFKIDQKMIDLIIRLKKKYKIGLLSNFTATWLHQLLDEDDLNKYFDGVTISSEIHFVKPEREIFEDMKKKLNTSFEKMIFIDDKEKNVEGAINIGIKGIFFESFDQLSRDLSKLGIM